MVADPLLSDLVLVADADPEARIFVTLVIDGAVLAGDIIGRAAYYAALLAATGRDLPGEAIAAWPADRAPEWMYLASAVMISGGRVVRWTGGAVPWAVRLADVSAWTLGKPSDKG